jgi:glycopeptide antibiotics resistance protein
LIDLQSYIHSILKNINTSEEKKTELADELYDHLLSIRREYIDKGIPEEEASKLAIYEFGNAKQIGKDIEKSLFPYQKIIKISSWALFFVYAFLVIEKLFLDSRIVFQLYQKEFGASYNLIPFESILQYTLNFNRYNLDTWLFNTFGNVIIFMPLGFLLPVIFNNMKRFKNIFIICLLTSLMIEMIQRITLLGFFDIDDIILNTIGGTFGFFGWFILQKISPRFIKHNNPSVN